MHMDVHKMLYTFYTTKKMAHVTAKITKIALRWRSSASFSLMLLFTQYETTWLAAISSYCIAALPAKMSAFNSHMRQKHLLP